MFVGLEFQLFKYWNPSSYELKKKIVRKSYSKKLNPRLKPIPKKFKEGYDSSSSNTEEAPNESNLSPRILTIELVVTGGNIINSMKESGVEGVEFLNVNTDSQQLKNSKG